MVSSGKQFQGKQFVWKNEVFVTHGTQEKGRIEFRPPRLAVPETGVSSIVHRPPGVLAVRGKIGRWVGQWGTVEDRQRYERSCGG